MHELYERVAPVVFRRARRIVQSDADAWDVVHDVFRRFIQQQPLHATDPQAGAYLYRMAINASLNLLKARARHVALAGPPRAEGADPQRTLELRDLLRLVGVAVDDRALQAAALFFLDGLSQEEVGEVLGVSKRTVIRDLERVREQLQGMAAGSVS